MTAPVTSENETASPVYEIARFLPRDALEAAAARVYPSTHLCGDPGCKRTGTSPRDADDFCPLGRAFAAAGYDASRVPVVLPEGFPKEAEPAFDKFIEDWDGGLIPDLRAAWGLS